MNQECEWFTPLTGCHVYRPRKEKAPHSVRSAMWHADKEGSHYFEPCDMAVLTEC